MAQVRYFAAAEEAAGCSAETVEASTLGDLTAMLVERHGAALDRVLRQCSLLVDGQATSDPATTLREDTAVDVLPPFAGG